MLSLYRFASLPLALLALLSPGFTAPAQTTPAAPATQPAPTAQTAPTTQAAPSASDLSREALIVEKQITQIREEADGTGTREQTMRVRMVAEAGVKDMAVLTFTYTADDQQVDIAYVRVIKPDGSIVVTPAYNVQDLPADVTREAPMYSDVHQKHVAVKGLGVGDTLEYKVTLRTVKPEVPGHFWFDYSFQKDLIVLDEQLDLDVPASQAITVASADVQPAITTAGARKLYHWASSNHARPDPDAPPKSTKNVKPSVQVTTFTSWAQVGAWYASLQKDQLAVTPAIQERADALTKGLTSPTDKINAIFNAVALHTHYVGLDFGIGRYQPHPADDVLSNEYGDCKDKHTLLATLLKAAGIEAWPVLISSSRDLDPAVPSPGQFDHVITVVPRDGKLLWMDSTAEIAPVGVLFGNLRDKQALAIPTAKPAYLERTPASLPYLQSSRFEVAGKLSDKGLFTGRVSQSYHGDSELIMRITFRAVPQSRWKEFVQAMSYRIGFAGDVKDPEVSPIEHLDEPLRLAYDYTREKYGEWDDHRISPAMPPVGVELAPGVKATKPADDVDLGSPGELDYISKIELPAGYDIAAPSDIHLKEDWAEYHATYSQKDGVFLAERRLVVKKNKVPLEDWDKYLDFRRAIYNDEVRMEPIYTHGSANIAEASAFAGGGMSTVNELTAKLQPIVDATSKFAQAAPPTGDDLTAAIDACRKTAAAYEAHSLELKPDDPQALVWAQMLGAGWTAEGWAALEAHDLPTAASHLEAAWRLSQSQLAGYLLGQVLEQRGDKQKAAHLYELASIAGGSGVVDNLSQQIDLRARLNDAYQKLTGHAMHATSLGPGGAYKGSLREELDKEVEMRRFVPVTRLTGQALFALAFEGDKPVEVHMLQGAAGMGSLSAALRAHKWPPAAPAGSKARVTREVKFICSPYGGCDAYVLLPSRLQTPQIVTLSPRIVQSAGGKEIKQVEILTVPVTAPPN